MSPHTAHKRTAGSTRRKGTERRDLLTVKPRNGSWITKVRASPWRTWQNTKRSHHQRGDTTFCISPCTPISYTSFLRPTAVSRLKVRARITSPVWASIHSVLRRCSSFPYEEYAQPSRLARLASQHPNRGSYFCANPKVTTTFCILRGACPRLAIVTRGGWFESDVSIV